MEARHNNFVKEDVFSSVQSNSKAVIDSSHILINPKSKLNMSNTDIVIWINDLHKALDDDYEAGIIINRLGKEVIFYIDHIAHRNHSMIYFKGHTKKGKLVHFVKHASDLSMQLTALKRKSSDEPKAPFGFDDWDEYESAKMLSIAS